mgnify:CR=1 FL=1
MKILVVDDEEDICEIVSMILETRLHLKAISVSSGNQAIQKLKQDQDIALVVCDYNMPDGNGGEVYAYMNKNGINIPFILCSSDAPEEHPEFLDKPVSASILKPFRAEVLIRVVKSSLKDKFSEPTLNNFYPIKLKQLIRKSTIDFDCYVKISEEKFVKISKKTEPFSQADYEEFFSRGVDALFLTAKDMEVFLDSYSKEVMLLSEAREIPIGTSYSELMKTFETVHEVVLRLGFSKEAVKLAKASAHLAVSIVMRRIEFADVTKNLEKFKNDYLNYHSVLLAYVGCLMAELVDLKSDMVQFKISLAAILHDIGLDDPRLAIAELQLPSTDEMKQWDEKSIEKFRSHPLEAAKQVRHLSGFPLGIDTLVLHHHERPDGTGFPEKLKAHELGQLDAIFILAHHLTNVLFITAEVGAIAKFLKDHDKLYSEHHFGALFQRLKEHFKAHAVR